MAYTADNLTVTARVFISRHMVRDGELLLNSAMWGHVIADGCGRVLDSVEDDVYIPPSLNLLVRRATGVEDDCGAQLVGSGVTLELIPNPRPGATRWKAVWVHHVPEDAVDPEDAPGGLPAFITG